MVMDYLTAQGEFEDEEFSELQLSSQQFTFKDFRNCTFRKCNFQHTSFLVRLTEEDGKLRKKRTPTKAKVGSRGIAEVAFSEGFNAQWA